MLLRDWHRALHPPYWVCAAAAVGAVCWERSWCKHEELGASLVTLTYSEGLAGSAPNTKCLQGHAKGSVTPGLLSLVEFALCSCCESPPSLWSNEGEHVVGRKQNPGQGALRAWGKARP